ncbi:MAG: LLM class flavin-dependent oxidoreductase [Acidobacteria bacterium]|nr:LLM class flavin-dependent oxidoreductase [Acidobacteriota bacterium]
MSRPFKLGFMLRIPTVDQGGSVEAVYRDALDLAVAADQLGFDSLWVTQHHFGGVDSSLPSPLVFLAAVAARTTRIRLGTTIITASLEHPIRLAEDIATLDVLSSGRVEVGLGTSSSELERQVFGVAAGDQRGLLHETAHQLVNAWKGRPVGGHADAVVQPHRPTLADRVWLATITRAHALFAAEHGFGLITNYRPSSLTPDNAGYLDDYNAIGSRTGAAPRIAMSRGVFPSADREAARRLLMPHAIRFVDRGTRLGWLPSSCTPDDFFTREDFHYGHPEEVVASLRDDPGLPYASELLTGMLSARIPPRDLIPTMERIAIDVAPALGWRPQPAVLN